MTRVTEARLQAIVDRINELSKSPKTTYTKGKNGKYKANIGNYHLDYAYGGVTLHRIMSTGGGVNCIFPGYHTKRELESLLFAFISGIGAA